MRAHIRSDITFQEAYLEAAERIDKNSYEESEAETLRRRFAGVKLDLVVAAGPPALLFAAQYRDKTFPGVPVVFMGVGSQQFGGKSWPGMTGVIDHIGIGETIDLALRLEPDTAAVAVISPYDPPWLEITHTELDRYKGRVRDIFLVGPPGPELFEKVAALPPHTVVLFDLALNDGQPPLAGFDLLDAVAQRVPTYSAWTASCLNHGCIGGAFEEATEGTQRAAEIAARVLSGEPVDKIPVAQIAGFQVRVDWQALQHWHIPESVLPAGALVLNRPPTLWEQGRKYFLAGFVILLAEALAILGLFWERARRRRAEIELGKSEEKFSKAFKHSPLSVTIAQARDGCYLDVNEIFEVHTGWKRDEVLGRTAQELGLWVNSDQRTVFMSRLLADGHVRDMEMEFRRKDGQIRAGIRSAELIELNGEQCALSVVADVTERKLAEEAMAGFGSRLIEAQEAERTRIARELHDDINQRLALVAMSLETARQDLSPSDAETSRRIEEVTEEICELGNDIQALSHRLHSSKLEYLGLEVAASGLCRELSERQNITIGFRCEDIPRRLSNETALCLFRVLQEALQNAVKYSGVKAFDVSLIGASEGIELRVHDGGAGFDPAGANKGHGLGLTSMKERLRSVDGELLIESKPGDGTTIIARVKRRVEEKTEAAEVLRHSADLQTLIRG